MKKIINICSLLVFVLGIVLGIVNANPQDSSLISVSLVNQDPDPAIAGDVVEIRVGVENRGGVASENLVLEFIPQYPFITITGENNIKEVGTIASYQYDNDMKIVKFKVRVDRDAIAGQYELRMKEYQKGYEEISSTKSLNIDVESKESAEIIHIDKSILIPGHEDSLKFTITNVGSAPLRDLTFSWVNEDKVILPVGSDNTKYIKYIEIGEAADLQYKVIANTGIDAGLYALDLSLTYDDPASGEQKEINTIAGIYVGGGTDFDIAFSESSSGQISFTIANIGSNPASSVSIIVPEQQSWKVSGSNSMIIGNLNTGDYTVASFTLQQSLTGLNDGDNSVDTIRKSNSEEISSQASAPQSTNKLNIQIAYTDTMGKREIIDKEVSISSQSLMSSQTATASGTSSSMPSFGGRRQQGFFSKYKWYIIIFVVLLVLGATYWIYKKKKQVNPNIRLKDIFKMGKLTSFFKKNKKK
ncbi:MAG: COG1361 S-layer family protein [Nanoarchaeota archaeon]|nr:COG1361 S-layer family protein [Nanoarchaeota archaeon]MBU1005847.1 COG1361 S-layer family protein [Nanoarchaeota archaeon]MBU1946109.1 COG1361 S-layer family protein [Nanoarchaeota archaeon]